MPVSIRPMHVRDAEAATNLVAAVFHQYVAPFYVPEGVAEFMAYVCPRSLVHRLQSNHNGFVALDDQGRLVGVIECRDSSHISLLFIDAQHQRMGIGKALVERILATCRQRDPPPNSLTVNASPNAVAAYLSFGFVATGPEQELNGIRFVPMRLDFHAAHRRPTTR